MARLELPFFSSSSDVMSWSEQSDFIVESGSFKNEEINDFTIGQRLCNSKII